MKQSQAGATRSIALWAALAAAVVILVPAAWVATDRLGDEESSDEPSPTPSSATSGSSSPSTTPTTPAPSPSSESTGSGFSGPFDVRDLSTGPAPQIAWSSGRDLHAGDGTVLAGVLPEGAGEFAPLGSGFLVATYADTDEVRFYGRDGRAGPKAFPLEGDLAVSPAGEVVAWMSPEGVPMVVQADGDERYEMPKIAAPGPYDAVAVTSEDCVEGRSTDAGCSVLVNTTGEQPGAWFSTSHGFSDRLNESILQVTARKDGREAGITEFRDDGSTCSAVFDETSDQSDFETCDHRLIAYSPDGRHLLGVGSIGDGFGDSEVAILDAQDGRVVGDLVSRRGSETSAQQLVWEDDSHVLMVTYSRGRWAVVRLGLDGSMEYAVAPRAGSDLERPFLLAS